MNIRNIIRGGIGNRERCLRLRCREMLFAKRERLVLGTNYFLLLFNTRTHTPKHTLEHSFCYLLFLHTLTSTQPLFAVQRFFSGKLRPRAGAGQAAVAAESKTYTSFRAGKIVLSHYHYRGPSIASDFVAGLYFFIYKNIKNTKKNQTLS